MKPTSLLIAILAPVALAVIAVAAALIVTLAIFVPTNASAQPYSPKPAKGSEVIFPLTFNESPLVFPFNETSRTKVASDGFLKFQHNFSNNYQEVVDYFNNSRQNGEELPILNLKSARFSDNKNVRVVGSSVGNAQSTFSVAVMGKPYQLNFTIYPTTNGSKIVVEGLISSTVFSGFVPWRAPFKPIGADPIPFRWN